MLYSPIYPTPRTPASLTWVPQSRLAFGHHRRVGWPWGPSTLGHHNPTVWNFACRWQIHLALQANQESFSNESHPISLIVAPQAANSNCLTATVGQRPLFSQPFCKKKIVQLMSLCWGRFLILFLLYPRKVLKTRPRQSVPNSWS